jgi:GeoRSP system SPASM domain protein
MSLPELSTPIRIYWDLTPVPADPPDFEKIVAGIVELKILALDLTATGSDIPSHCFSILEKCSTARLGVTLTVSPAAYTTEAAESLDQAPPRELLFEITGIDALRSHFPLPQPVAGVSMPLCSHNWQQIPEVIHFCSENDIRHLVFPMQRLYRGEAPFYIPVSGLKTISNSLLTFSPNPSLTITAHDPFVWRAIFPLSPFPEGRCQAANTMLSIDQEGIVYPCPVMPVPLGSLREMTLKEIAKGELKRELRSKLLSLPGECTECPDAKSCQGGCRGRGERFYGSWEALDPGCKEDEQT